MAVAPASRFDERSQPAEHEPAGGFVRRLNLFDATMIVISGMIGSGIFINPYVVAEKVSTPFLILAVWVAGGAIALAGAFVFAELSTVLPRVGGQYAFFREALHPLVAFLHGWTLLLVIQSASTAAVAVAFAEYVARLFGWTGETTAPLAVAILLATSVFHSVGVRPGALVINVITFGKTIALGLLIVGAFAATRSTGIHFAPLVPPGKTSGDLLSAFFSGLVPAMFAYGGWQNLNFVAEEVREPLRNLPRAILLGVIAVIIVYVGANAAYLHVLSAPTLAASRTPAADVAERLAGTAGARVVSLLIIASTFGFLNLSLLAGPRVYYAMAADGLFFPVFGRLSERQRIPTAAILLQGGLAAAYAASNKYETLLNYTVFADWVFFALAGVALIVFRSTRPAAPRPYAAPFYPWIPALFILAGLGIVANTFIADGPNAWRGAAIIALGVPVYAFWMWNKPRAIDA